jgi:hypothetical protein
MGLQSHERSDLGNGLLFRSAQGDDRSVRQPILNVLGPEKGKEREGRKKGGVRTIPGCKAHILSSRRE